LTQMETTMCVPKMAQLEKVTFRVGVESPIHEAKNAR